jgi:alkanesulfonate monooxygenase SsuD/methylene tetrahydromethanopterin reductase-like flavin-dependent oxidoreductase (luciferase family)
MASPMLTVVRASFLELFLLETNKRGYRVMTTELNELLNAPDDDKVQIWIIGTRDQVIHQINEFYVKRIATDRIKFTPIIPAPFAKGKYMTVLVR